MIYYFKHETEEGEDMSLMVEAAWPPEMGKALTVWRNYYDSDGHPDEYMLFEDLSEGSDGPRPLHWNFRPLNPERVAELDNRTSDE